MDLPEQATQQIVEAERMQPFVRSILSAAFCTSDITITEWTVDDMQANTDAIVAGKRLMLRNRSHYCLQRYPDDITIRVETFDKSPTEWQKVFDLKMADYMLYTFMDEAKVSVVAWKIIDLHELRQAHDERLLRVEAELAQWRQDFPGQPMTAAYPPKPRTNSGGKQWVPLNLSAYSDDWKRRIVVSRSLMNWPDGDSRKLSKDGD